MNARVFDGHIRPPTDQPSAIQLAAVAAPSPATASRAAPAASFCKVRESWLRDTPLAPAGRTKTSFERLAFRSAAPGFSAASRHDWQTLWAGEAIPPPRRRRFAVSKSIRRNAPLASGLPVLLVRLASEGTKFPIMA